MSTIVRGKCFKGELFLGGIKSAKNLELLGNSRVTAVLTVANDVYVDYEGTNIRHMQIKVKDTVFEDLGKHFQSAITFIEQELQRGNVLVHCRLGVSRSASIVTAYLMKSKGLTYEQALNHIKHKRFQINPNAGFREQLQKYEKLLKQPQN